MSSVAVVAAAALSLGCTARDVVGYVQLTATAEPEDAASSAPLDDPVLASDAMSAVPTPCSVLLCEGFEDAAVNDALVLSGGDAERDCMRAQSGNCSLWTGWQEGGAQATWQADFVAGEQLFVRAWLWVPSELAVADVAVLHIGPGNSATGVNVDLRSGERYEVYAVAARHSVLTDPGVLVRNRWTCVVLGITPEADEHRLTLDVDGAEVLSTMAADVFAGGTPSFVAAGADWTADNQAPGQLWLDSIDVAEEPLTCP